ncbi:MAG: pyridoxine 5'-phosphate synthase, partial [Planctomycetota bacterium]|nr:pyridoxine 5'-phosphate synthase [Planctomycetota bacterium]
SVIRIWDWRRYVIPNSQLLQQDFINYSLTDSYQWAYVEFWVSYEADLSLVEKLASDATAASGAFVDYEPPSFWVMEMGKDGIRCWVAGWTDNASDAWALTHDVRTKLAMALHAHGITCHLRKDRRHVQDADIHRLRGAVTTLLNLEVSLDPEMLGLADRSGAEAFCVVPENRLEITTEGGLDVIRETPRLKDAVPRLAEAGGAVSIFIDPDPAQLDAAASLGAPFVELHTGAYASASGPVREAELARLADATAHARSIGLRVNAGHGLDFENVGSVAAIEGVEELNIGFAMVARAVFDGVETTVKEMLRRIEEAVR